MIHLFIYDQDILENTLTDFLTLFDRNSSEVKIWISNKLLSEMEIQDTLLEQKIDDISYWDKKSYQQKDAKYWRITDSPNPFNLLINSCLAEILERINHEHFSNDYFFLIRLTNGYEKEYVVKTTNDAPNNSIFCSINCIQFNSLADVLVKLAPYSEKIIQELLDTSQKIWENKSIFKNLIFCDKTQKQLDVFTGDSLRQIIKSLNDLDNYCAEWKKEKNIFDYKNRLTNVTEESETNQRKNKDLLNVLCPDKHTREFSLHFKITSSEMSIRLFFFHDGKTGNCFIGNVIPKKDIK